MSLASEYAESVGRKFWEQHEAGHVFGLAECDECGAGPGEECTPVEGDDADEPNRGHAREEATAWDFLADALSVEYVVSSDGTYRGAEILTGFGGPNVWVDTRSRDLVVVWDGRATWGLPSDMVSALDEAAAEMWESAR